MVLLDYILILRSVFNISPPSLIYTGWTKYNKKTLKLTLKLNQHLSKLNMRTFINVEFIALDCISLLGALNTITTECISKKDTSFY